MYVARELGHQKKKKRGKNQKAVWIEIIPMLNALIPTFETITQTRTDGMRLFVVSLAAATIY